MPQPLQPYQVNPTQVNQPLGFQPYSQMQQVWVSPQSPVYQDPPPKQGGVSISPTSLLNNSGSIGKGITGAIDKFGTNLGFAPGTSMPAPSAGFVGPMPAQAGSLGTTATLSSALGGAAMGAGIGGFAASLTGGNPTTGSIGGGAGGLIAAGAGFGPVGIAVGGLLGGLGGGLFGKKKPSDKTQSGGFNIGTSAVNRMYADTKSMTGSKASAENSSIRDQWENAASAYNKWLQANGAVPLGDEQRSKDLIIQVGSRDGYKSWISGAQSPTRYGKDASAFSKGIVDQINSMYNIPPELQAKLAQMPLDNLLAFGKQQQKNQAMQLAQPMVPNAPPSTKESFKDFAARYKSTGATTPRV